MRDKPPVGYAVGQRGGGGGGECYREVVSFRRPESPQLPMYRCVHHNRERDLSQRLVVVVLGGGGGCVTGGGGGKCYREVVSFRRPGDRPSLRWWVVVVLHGRWPPWWWWLCYISGTAGHTLDTRDISWFTRAYSMLRSYHHESTRSHQNSEVKRGWARLVLG